MLRLIQFNVNFVQQRVGNQEFNIVRPHDATMHAMLRVMEELHRVASFVTCNKVAELETDPISATLHA